MDEETKLKISKSLKGRVPWNAGMTMPKSFGKKISKALKGRVIDDEWRRKMSEAKLGVKRGPHTKKHKKAISEGMRRHFESQR